MPAPDTLRERLITYALALSLTADHIERDFGRMGDTPARIYREVTSELRLLLVTTQTPPDA